MYKVTYYFNDGTKETKIVHWRFCPECRDLDGKMSFANHGGLKAFKIENATEEDKLEATKNG